jgi:hypothetical protein
VPTASVHLSLVEAGDSVEFRYWRDDPNQFDQRRLRLDEIHDLARKSEADYYSVRQPDLFDVGRRLYKWLDGDDRWLARQLEDLRGAGEVALLIEARGALAHLPWETLRDGTSFLVHRTAPAVLPVRWKPQPAKPRRPKNRALNVLFMASSPEGVTPVLDYERGEG